VEKCEFLIFKVNIPRFYSFERWNCPDGFSSTASCGHIHCYSAQKPLL